MKKRERKKKKEKFFSGIKYKFGGNNLYLLDESEWTHWEEKKWKRNFWLISECHEAGDRERETEERSYLIIWLWWLIADGWCDGSTLD